MKFLNLNALQTYASAALVAVPALFVSQGCTQAPVIGTLDCSHAMLPFLTPTVTLYTTAVLALLKFVVVPMLQPGGPMRNLFSEKVPVSTSGASGTVLPSDITPPEK